MSRTVLVVTISLILAVQTPATITASLELFARDALDTGEPLETPRGHGRGIWRRPGVGNGAGALRCDFRSHARGEGGHRGCGQSQPEGDCQGDRQRCSPPRGVSALLVGGPGRQQRFLPGGREPGPELRLGAA